MEKSRSEGIKLCFLFFNVAQLFDEAIGEENSLNLGQTNRLGPASGRMRETETILSVGDWAPVDSFDSNTYSRWVSLDFLSLFQDFFLDALASLKTMLDI